MIISCEKCDKKFELSDELIPVEGRLLQCGSCSYKWHYTPTKTIKLVNEICKKYKIKNQNIAYIGDDINDLEIMKRVGLSACPKNAVKEIIKISNFVCKKNGGDGAFREFVDHILSKSKN